MISCRQIYESKSFCTLQQPICSCQGRKQFLPYQSTNVIHLLIKLPNAYIGQVVTIYKFFWTNTIACVVLCTDFNGTIFMHAHPTVRPHIGCEDPAIFMVIFHVFGILFKRISIDAGHIIFFHSSSYEKNPLIIFLPQNVTKCPFLVAKLLIFLTQWAASALDGHA